MRPIFFAPTDIQPGGLNEELKSRLRASRNLVVICSPNSAQSKWVGEEIKYFHELGRTDNIHFFIVRGTPHSANPDEECINPIVDELGIPEILGANIHEKTYALPLLNKERAYAQLISKLLGIEFDTIWKRHKRQLTRKVLAWTFGITAVVCAFFAIKNANQSFDMEMVGEMVPTATIRVGEWELSPDSDGLYSIHVPIEKQMPKYGISGGSATLSTDTIYMPYFEGNVVRVIPR